MSYQIKVIPRLDRETLIKEYSRRSDKKKAIYYRGQHVDQPVVRIAADVLLYRINNGRTEVEQLEHVRRKGLPANFFVDTQENIAAQQEQHEILLRMARDDKGDIYRELAQISRQTEELLITSSGVVVNGNRRLAAMRDLLAKDPSVYSAYEWADAVVLPSDATESDLDEIETVLQIVPETKLPYGWIEHRLKIRKLKDQDGRSAEYIRQLLRYNSTADVDRELLELSLAEEYLTDVLNEPTAYKRVDSAYQAFKELARTLTRRNSPDPDLARAIAFGLIRGSDAIEDSIYSRREAFGKDAEVVARRVADRVGIPTVPAPVQSGGDVLDELAGNEAGSYGGLIDYLLNGNAKEVAQNIAEAFDDERAARKDDERKVASIESIRRAHKAIVEVDVTKLTNEQLGEAVTQLDAIADSVDRLQQQLKKRLS